jgi:hypothetical protein
MTEPKAFLILVTLDGVNSMNPFDVATRFAYQLDEIVDITVWPSKTAVEMDVFKHCEDILIPVIGDDDD